MIIEVNECKNKTCILVLSGMDKLRPNKSSDCLGDKCLAYWRWVDNTRNEGYCSLGSKPIF